MSLIVVFPDRYTQQIKYTHPLSFNYELLENSVVHNE